MTKLGPRVRTILQGDQFVNEVVNECAGFSNSSVNELYRKVFTYGLWRVGRGNNARLIDMGMPHGIANKYYLMNDAYLNRVTSEM